MDKNEEKLLTEVSYLYYKKQYSQDKIAKKLFISRSTVSRALQKAIDNGIVEINIKFPYKRFERIENDLISAFGIDACQVLETDNNIGFEQLCKHASKYINDTITNDCVIGVSSGSTVREVCSHLDFHLLNNITFSQIKGNAGMGSKYSYDSPSTIIALANKFNANFNLIYAPLYVFSETVRDYLNNELIIKEALDIAQKSDIIISSVGIPSEDDARIYSNYVNSKNMKELFNKKPIATFVGHFLDENGNSIDENFEDSIIGLTLEDLKYIKNTVVVVYEEEKYKALYSVLKSKVANTLIVSEKCAKKLLNYYKIQNI